MAASNVSVRIEWFGKSVIRTIESEMTRRIGRVIVIVQRAVVTNISIPVHILIGPRGGRIVFRSKPGEFPRADTTDLMRSIFTHQSRMTGYIATPQIYGKYLEKDLDRSFLVRTLHEERPTIRRILTARIR